MARIRISKVTRALFLPFLFLLDWGVARAENPCEQPMNAPSPSSVTWPSPGASFSSAFGPRRRPSGAFDFHEGVDIKSSETNMPVRSVQVGSI
jgi:murein DD-endopeptidase MepM/ murein hydrolase activator NlpD